MAQYTTVLASDYNNMRAIAVNTIGEPGLYTSQGAYNNASKIVSSNVSVGQRITPTEWANLKYDLTTAYYFQTGSVPSINNPVTGNVINWSDIVQYQTFANAINSNAANHTSYAPFRPQVDSGIVSSVNGSWGGNGLAANAACTIDFAYSSSQDIQAMFNAGGSFQVSFTTSGGSGTGKDKALTDAAAGISTTLYWSDFWYTIKNGGTYSISWSTNGKAGYSPYDSSARRLDATLSISHNIYIPALYATATFTDYDTGTSSDGSTAAKTFGATVRAQVISNYLSGSTPPGGASIATNAPSQSVSWSYY